MKGWKIVKPHTVSENEIPETEKIANTTKVKITKALLTLSDVLRYNGDISTEEIVLGSFGIGVVSEADANLFGVNKGDHVYIEPNKPCMGCYNCKNGETDKCSSLLVAGEDYDGFLSDFVSAETDKIYALPDNVTDTEALFIGHISLAEAIFDKLEIDKGDYVAIVGTDNFANIFAQLLIYYQAVPIVLGYDEEGLNSARQSGIYYVLGQEDNWVKEVSAITGGRMTKSVVYVSDSNIPVVKAFSIASYNAGIVITGLSNKNNSVSFSQAIKKQLNIHCISDSVGNTATSINLLANKAINFSHLKTETESYEKVPEVLEKMNKDFEETGKICETIIEQNF